MKNFFKYYKWFIAGFWLIIGLAGFFQFIDTCLPLESALYVLGFLTLSISITTFTSNYLFPRALKKGKMHVFVFQFIILSILLAFSYALLTKGVLLLEKNGIFPPSIQFTELERPFIFEFLANLLSAFMANLLFCAMRFFREHYIMLQEHAKLQQSSLEDQLHLLRAQINPHMMFNILNHIHILMKKNVDVADELLLRYSDVLRYQLYECNREIVFIEKEVEYLKDIVEVEKIRWGNELKVDCSWDIENGRKEISPLLLIPFVENAFKHVSRLPSQTGYVNIILHQKGDILHFEVENSKTDQAPQRGKASGLGLENVKKRLHILYPEKHELSVKKDDHIYKTTLIISL